MMTKLQIGVIAGAVGLVLLLLLGFSIKPPEQKAIEQSRALTAESTDAGLLIKEAKAELSPEKSGVILGLEQMLAEAKTDSVRIQVLQQLAGEWFRNERPDISGFFAEELANLAETEEAWSITGTTYSLCVQRVKDQKIRDFCTGRAIKALENAISLHPAEVRHRVNLALVYTDNPPSDNPMKGILMLRELNEQHPDNALILKNLGRLAIKTGQFARAQERLERALMLAPQDKDIICLLAETYKGLGDVAKADAFAADCSQMTGN